MLMSGVEVTNPPNKYGETPLHMAAANGHREVCRMIVERNMHDPNPGDKFGNTPLHEAARKGHLEVYQLVMDLVEDKNPARHVCWRFEFGGIFGRKF